MSPLGTVALVVVVAGGGSLQLPATSLSLICYLVGETPISTSRLALVAGCWLDENGGGGHVGITQLP